ncbi:hypothetical protein ACH470_27010 [Streptomyces bottropensis]|uniref:hypothetical protein n=1 Tax=Streptomyces bottropensis TaxID=42235 RepID=UPI00035DA8B6
MDGLGETDAAEGGGGAEHPGGLARRPKPAEAMTSAAYASLQAVPMRLHDRSLGALTLLRRRAGHLAEEDVPLAQALGDARSDALVDRTGPR